MLNFNTNCVNILVESPFFIKNGETVDMNTVGQRIKQLRVKSGMTQHQLAERLGVSTSTVGMYESGRRSPDNEMLVKIGSVFSVTIDSLLGVSELSSEATDIITEMRDRIMHGNGIMLNGIPMSMEDREKLLDAIEVATKVMIAEKEKRDHAEK